MPDGPELPRQDLMKRWLPLLALMLLLLLALAMGWHRHLSWASLRANHAALASLTMQYPLFAALAFMGVYAGAVAMAVPGAGVLGFAGGLLFGIVLGSVLTVLGATAGAAVLFLAARGALAEHLARRFAPLAARLRPGLERNGFSYLLALRLVGLVPFVLPNLAAALVGMRLAPFVTATFIGLIPSTLVITGIGSGLRDILAAGQEPRLSLLLTPAVLLPLLGMAVLALLPVAWRHWKADNA